VSLRPSVIAYPKPKNNTAPTGNFFIPEEDNYQASNNYDNPDAN
jgi:hypothetical protein